MAQHAADGFTQRSESFIRDSITSDVRNLHVNHSGSTPIPGKAPLTRVLATQLNQLQFRPRKTPRHHKIGTRIHRGAPATSDAPQEPDAKAKTCAQTHQSTAASQHSEARDTIPMRHTASGFAEGPRNSEASRPTHRGESRPRNDVTQAQAQVEPTGQYRTPTPGPHIGAKKPATQPGGGGMNTNHQPRGGASP